MTASDPSSRGPRPIAAMRERRDEGIRRRNEVREQRWREQRFSVPYPTDGPKVTLGVLWAAAVLFGAWTTPPVLALVVASVAALAGLQAGTAWEPLVDPRITAVVAGITALAGLGGALGLGIALVLLAPAMGAVAAGTATGDRDHLAHVAETLARASLPLGLAAGSLVAIEGIEFSAMLALVILVSSYEAGDFLIGTGSANAIEGPVAGLVAMVVVSAALYIVLPAPFTTDSFPLFVILTAVAAPLGQIAGSAVLPRGDSWAPAVRRLDSYLIAAPLWLLLMPRL